MALIDDLLGLGFDVTAATKMMDSIKEFGTEAEAKAGEIGTEAYEAMQFKPFTVTSGVGSTTAGAVGTYAFLGSNVIISEGSTTAASNLQFAGSPRLSAGNAPSGTWQCMGMIYRTGYSDATVFVRIS